MLQQILTTKLLQPKNDGIIHRPELVQQLESPTGTNLTVVSAPAGYGKTSLICNWLHHTDASSSWISLDEYDNQPGTFWRYFVAALKRIDPAICKKAEKIISSQHSDGLPRVQSTVFSNSDSVNVSETLIETVIESLHKYSSNWNCPARFLLILDDFHHIDDPSIIRGLSRLLDYSPSWLELVITSRTLPDLSISNRCSKGKARVIDQLLLQWTSDFTRNYLQDRFKLTIGSKQAQNLTKYTSGWAAIIHLLGLTASQHKNLEILDSHPELNNQSLLSDFLFSEVFNRLDHLQQSLLLIASTLDQLPTSLCLSILKDNNIFSAAQFDTKLSISVESIQQTLHTLARNGLFISSLGDNHFRVHGLFKDWLIQYGLEQKTELYRNIQASTLDWLIDSERTLEAITLAAMASKWNELAELLDQTYLSLISTGNFSFVVSIIEQIPQSELNQLPQLLILQAIVEFNLFELGHAEQSLLQADRLLGVEETKLQSATTASALVIKSQIARFQGNSVETKRIANHLEQYPQELKNQFQEWSLFGAQVDAFFEDDMNESIEYGLTALSESEKRNNPYCMILSLTWLMHSMFHNGQSRTAIEIATNKLTMLTKLHGDNLNTLSNLPGLYGGMVMNYIELNELNSAWKAYYSLVQSIHPLSDPRDLMFSKYYSKIQLLLASGLVEQAQSTLDQFKTYESELMHHRGLNFSVLLSTEVLQALIDLKSKNFMPLIIWAKDKPTLDNNNCLFKYRYEYFLYNIAHLVAGVDESKAILEVIGQSLKTGTHSRAISGLLALAKACLSIDKKEDGLQLFLKALELGEQKQFVHVFIEDSTGLNTLSKLFFDQSKVQKKYPVHFDTCKWLLKQSDNRIEQQRSGVFSEHCDSLTLLELHESVESNGSVQSKESNDLLQNSNVVESQSSSHGFTTASSAAQSQSKSQSHSKPEPFSRNLQTFNANSLGPSLPGPRHGLQRPHSEDQIHSSQSLAGNSKSGVLSNFQNRHMDPLSPREIEVLEKLQVGLSNKDIALQMNLSVATVKRHLQNIYQKLQVKNRTEAVLVFSQIRSNEPA